MWARAALAILALFGSCTYAVPIPGLGHLRNLGHPFPDGEALSGSRSQTHSSSEVRLTEPFFTENVSEAIFDFHPNYRDYGAWRKALCSHIWDERRLRGCIAVGGDIVANFIEPIRIKDAFKALGGVLKSDVPEKTTSWRLAAVRGNESYAGRRNPEHDKINCSIFNMNVGSDLCFTDAACFFDVSLSRFPQVISRSPKEDCCKEKKSGERSNKEPLIFVHEAKSGGNKSTNPAGDWMALIVLGWFLLPVASIICRLRWLFVSWAFGMGLILLSAMLGLI